MKSKLKRSTKNLLALLVLLPTAVLVLGTIYMLGMTHLEGAPRTFLQGVQTILRNFAAGARKGDHHEMSGKVRRMFFRDGISRSEIEISKFAARKRSSN